MKKILLGSVTAMLLSSAAHAGSVSCDQPRVTPYDADPNPVVAIEVDYNAPAHAWQIIHRFANGDAVNRAQQYAIVDRSKLPNLTQWGGSLNRNRTLYMIGQVFVDRTGNGRYEEWLYDRSHGNHLNMHMVARCWLNTDEDSAVSPAPGPAWQPPIIVPVPVPSRSYPGQPWPEQYPMDMPRQPAPLQQNGPTQQNGPNNNNVIAPPSNNTNNFTIIIPDRGAPVVKTEPGS